MCRHFLRVLERAAVGEIGGDAGCPETVTADRRVDAGRERTTADHAPSIGLRHGFLKEQRRVVPRRGPEQIPFTVLGNTGGIAP